MAKFFFFEKVVEAFYTHVFTAPKESYAKSTQLGITFASGYLAGVICAIVSHPADTVSFVANDCVFFHSRNGEEFREHQLFLGLAYHSVLTERRNMHGLNRLALSPRCSVGGL
jgi:hypothetical protein